MTNLQRLHAALPLAAWLAVDVLASYRLTRLVTRDSLPPIKRARDMVLARWGDSPWSELAVCAWCMGVWTSAGVVLARLVAPVPWSALSLTLATSAVVAWLSVRE